MELAELLAHWGTGPVGGVEAVLQGSVNRVFRVQVGQQTLYLRLYRSSDITVLEREALVMAAARLDGILVPIALPTRSGAGWMNMDGQLCALFQAVTGFQVVCSDLTVEQARVAGACLARLHRALEPPARPQLAAIQRRLRPGGVADSTRRFAAGDRRSERPRYDRCLGAGASVSAAGLTGRSRLPAHRRPVRAAPDHSRQLSRRVVRKVFDK